MRCQKRVLSSIVVTAVLLLFNSAAEPFYERGEESGSLEARGFLDLAGGYSSNPDMPLLYQNRKDNNFGGTARLLADGKSQGSGLGFEFNGVVYGYGSTAVIPVPPDVERSSAVEWTVRDTDKSRSHLVVDHLNLRFTSGGEDLIVGRQAISLATCFYFTPNDFFAPFSAQTFFRVFKPGVDAARLEVKLGDLSQLSLFSVLGYAPNNGGANGWSASPDRGRTSYMAKASTAFSNFQWSLIGGEVANSSIIGGSFQGELFHRLGVRGEGHYAGNSGGSHAEAVIGIERRLTSGLTLRYEEFYNGQGAGATSQYQLASWNTALYHAMNYGAFGGEYQFTPLLTGQALIMFNFTDGSDLAALYAVYSLSDNSELSIGLNLPYGSTGPANIGFSPTATIGSEFGTYPYSAAVDLRLYF